MRPNRKDRINRSRQKDKRGRSQSQGHRVLLETCLAKDSTCFLQHFELCPKHDTNFKQKDDARSDDLPLIKHPLSPFTATYLLIMTTAGKSWLNSECAACCELSRRDQRTQPERQNRSVPFTFPCFKKDQEGTDLNLPQKKALLNQECFQVSPVNFAHCIGLLGDFLKGVGVLNG